MVANFDDMSKEELIRELWKEKAKNARKFLRLNTDIEIWEGYNTLVICNKKTGDRAYYNRERRNEDNWYANYREEYPEAKSVKEIRELENKRGNYFNPSEIYGCNGYKRLRAVETSLEDEISIMKLFEDEL